MKRKIFVLAVVSFWILGVGVALSNDNSFRSKDKDDDCSCFFGNRCDPHPDAPPWRDHARPYTFLFGNHFDTHQQTRLLSDGDLFGFLYIVFTGEKTKDGLRIAVHCAEDTPDKKCVAGWVMRGKPGRATFVFHADDEHPLWLVNRTDIPQPGAYAHFHWLGAPPDAAGLTPGDIHEGYFLELCAIRTFAFRHGGEEIPVTPGIDIATHVNIVAIFPGFAPPPCCED